MIRTTNITKVFKGRKALDSVSVEFPPQSVTALVGPNGSGKTTLAKVLLGLVKPTDGSFTINGASGLDNAAARESMGYMAQIARYPENLTALEVVSMIKGLRHTVPTINVDELIHQFALTEHMAKPMRSLSGGTRQKVGAVIAFMFRPTILLLDEPTAGLDPIAADRLKEQILQARNNGAAVIVTSHLLSELQEVADRIVYLQEGRVIHHGSVDQLMVHSGTSSLTDAVLSLMQQGGVQ